MERQNIVYSETEILINNEYRNMVLSQIKLDILTDKTTIYPNQQMTANKILSLFEDTKLLCVMNIQPTQSGKTGVMYAISKLFIEQPTCNIDPRNIFIISGLSSVDWKKQTVERFPELISKNIYHRNNLEAFLEQIQKDPRNAIIIMDEIQIANTKGQCVSHTLENAGLFNFEFLCKNNIKIIQFSATPDGCFYDIKKWNEDNYKVILGDIDNRYVSAMDIYNDKRVFQCKPLISYCDKEKIVIDDDSVKNVQEIKQLLNTKFDQPSYIIIRVPTKKQEYKDSLMALKNIFPEDDYNYIEYNQSLNIDINILCLNNKPYKTTFIIIKEKLRVAFTINQSYISILYDRHVNYPSDSVIIQSLLGRATGFKHNSNIYIFTNIDSIKKYDKLIKSGFKDNNVNWRSLSTKKVQDTLLGDDTFNSVKNYKDMEGFKIDIRDCYEVPAYIQVTKKEMDSVLLIDTSKRAYNQNNIFQLIKKYNEDLYYRLCNSEKCDYQLANKNYKRLIIDKINNANNNSKSPFFKKILMKLKNTDYHNIFFDNKLNRIVIEFFNGSKLN